MRRPWWRPHPVPGPRWEDDPRNVAWADEIDAAIDAGDLDRLAAAQAAVRLAPGDRPSLVRAVQYRPGISSRAVQDVELPPEAVEAVQEAPVLTVTPGKRLRGAYARRAARAEGETS